MIMTQQLLNKKPVMDSFLQELPGRLASHSFTNVFAWRDFFTFELKVLDGCLCVFARNEMGCFLYLPPLGKHVTLRVIDTCFDRMEEENHGSGVTRVEHVAEYQLRLFPTKRYAAAKRGYEYCYYKDDIAELRGNEYKSKRSSYNQFVKRCSHRYAAYHENMEDDCTALYRQWADQRRQGCFDDIYRQMLKENEKVHQLVLRHYRSLGLTGRVVFVEDKIKAYSFGYPVHDGMFCILFEIADLDIKGLPVYIFREFCRDRALRRYPFINVMDDFGLDNIRQTKMSFRPRALLQSYTVTKR